MAKTQTQPSVPATVDPVDTAATAPIVGADPVTTEAPVIVDTSVADAKLSFARIRDAIRLSMPGNGKLSTGQKRWKAAVSVIGTLVAVDRGTAESSAPERSRNRSTLRAISVQLPLVLEIVANLLADAASSNQTDAGVKDRTRTYDAASALLGTIETKTGIRERITAVTDADLTA